MNLIPRRTAIRDGVSRADLQPRRIAGALDGGYSSTVSELVRCTNSAVARRIDNRDSH